MNQILEIMTLTRAVWHCESLMRKRKIENFEKIEKIKIL